MFIVNHFLDLALGDIKFPDQLDAPTTNGLGSIMKQSNICIGNYGRNPNVVLVSGRNPPFLLDGRW